MNCPGCSRREDLHDTAPKGGIVQVWCSYCGTLTEKRADGTLFRVRRPILIDPIREAHGLLTVAADAIQTANREIGRVEASTTHPQTILWSITEAISAIIHDLDARGGGPTAAERQDMRAELLALVPRHKGLDVQSMASLVSKAIADGVDAVHRERERCAKLAESAAGFGVGNALAKKIREVPT